MPASTRTRLMPPGEACFFTSRPLTKLIHAYLGSTVCRAKATLQTHRRGASGMSSDSLGRTFAMHRLALCPVRGLLQHSHSREGEGFGAMLHPTVRRALAVTSQCRALVCKTRGTLSAPTCTLRALASFENSPDSRLRRENE